MSPVLDSGGMTAEAEYDADAAYVRPTSAIMRLPIEQDRTTESLT